LFLYTAQRSCAMPSVKQLTVSISGFVGCSNNTDGRRLHLDPSTSETSLIDCLLC